MTRRTCIALGITASSLVVLIILLIALTAGKGHEEVLRSRIATRIAGADPVAAGAVIFSESGCNGCHSVTYDAAALGVSVLYLDVARGGIQNRDRMSIAAIQDSIEAHGKEYFVGRKAKYVDYSTLLTEEWIRCLVAYLGSEVAAREKYLESLTMVERGQELHSSIGCAACHNLATPTDSAPTYSTPWGAPVRLRDGRVVNFDRDYVRESIVDPRSNVKVGYSDVMPKYDLPEEHLAALVAYIESVSRAAAMNGAAGESD